MLSPLNTYSRYVSCGGEHRQGEFSDPGFFSKRLRAKQCRVARRGRNKIMDWVLLKHDLSLNEHQNMLSYEQRLQICLGAPQLRSGGVNPRIN